MSDGKCWVCKPVVYGLKRFMFRVLSHTYHSGYLVLQYFSQRESVLQKFLS